MLATLMLLHLISFRALQFQWHLVGLNLPIRPSGWMHWEESLVLATHAAFDCLQSIAVLVAPRWVEDSYPSLRMDVLGKSP